jgi:hypothetical protein
MHRATPYDINFRGYSSGGCRTLVDTIADEHLMQESTNSQGMKGESWPTCESPQNYGFTSVVADARKSGNPGKIQQCAEGFMSFIGGNRNFPVMAMMDDRRHRLINLAKDAAKGASALFGLKEWGQQFLNTDTGMFMTGNTEKLLKFALVDNQNGQSQQSSGGGSGGGASRFAPISEHLLKKGAIRKSDGRIVIPSPSGVEFDVEEFIVEPRAANGGGSGGASNSDGSQGSSKPTGQKTLHKQDSKIYKQFDKNAIFTRHNDGYANITPDISQTYHKDPTHDTRCDQNHVHIGFSGMKIWVDESGCWSTKPIQIRNCDDKGGTSSGGPPTSGPPAMSASSPMSIDNSGNMSMAVQNPLSIMSGAEYARDIDNPVPYDFSPKTVQPLGLLCKAPLFVDTDGYLTSTGGGAGGISEAPNDAYYYARHALGWSALGSMANQNSNTVAITGGTIDGITLDGGTF